MCGIIGAVAQRDIVEILLDGLRRLEYRGYDSAGLSVIDKNKYLQRLRCVGKVNVLTKAVRECPLFGNIGIAHTRWATHGKPTEINAHPHISGHIVVVHNGIIENHEFLREQLRTNGYTFVTETDTEVIAHMIHWWQRKKNGVLMEAVHQVVNTLRGAYGAAIIDSHNPSVLVAIRSGSPLVIGLGIGENFLASDQLALLPVTRRFVYLEEGDIAEITHRTVRIWNQEGQIVKRTEIKSEITLNSETKGKFKHYMQKEIFDQPKAIKKTLEGRFNNNLEVMLPELSKIANAILSQVKHIHIIACGTSYHAAMVSRYWFESLARISCDIDIASEFCYRKPVIRSNSLLIALSQSGETADILAALQLAKKLNYLGLLAVCNVSGSSLVRQSDMSLMTRAGIEISVASTKTFTTQLAVLLILVIHIGLLCETITNRDVKDVILALQTLPSQLEKVLLLSKPIKALAKSFFNKHHAFFLGRGSLYPIAMEGALKLKEVSYIHAEAYAAGELKHGPLALIDSTTPVIVVAPDNELLEKTKSNIEEVRARGGLLYIFSERDSDFTKDKKVKIITMPHVEKIVAPIFYTVPLQLLAYHTAIIKGTDIDRPRNLAKSVTVE
ncbi:glutamine--fructose-6-phosphate transaminase (isomerizing) [Sodalis sp. CWE]|uniref:glutamine--fructose-6-phosphate transaminase (isomerizing) n=1 Tax=Sodalis sp. CWE TaxID=2803816 RepID=UPI001C7D20D0|nr:glutamine--fructose-6-phosphate transaminase (isomerizing) [Sodalis sp. CWE]MBX4181095.1 glutamine--fructose-6-phosphate transaminase (isomerizing) [Sodalis sp. CWE]